MRDMGSPMPYALGRWFSRGVSVSRALASSHSPPAATPVPSGTVAAGPPPGTVPSPAAAGGAAAGRCCSKAAAVKFKAEEPPEEPLSRHCCALRLQVLSPQMFQELLQVSSAGDPRGMRRPPVVTGVGGRSAQPGSPHDILESRPYVGLHRCRALPRGIALNVGTREPELIAPNRRLDVEVVPCAARGGRRVPAPPDRHQLQTDILTDGGAKGGNLPGACRVLDLQVIVRHRFLLDWSWVRSCLSPEAPRPQRISA